MGEVYRATDTRLGRDVALKILPPDVASDSDRLARFQREARVVAALNHPNVVTLYSVEESENVHFITMELVEGQTLDRLIPASGLPADRIIEIASAIAEALAAAHEKGIVHRDLKPANVMITSEGRVKVLDFGLAKDVNTESSHDATLTSAGHTQAGIVMGTPSYMSPEQVSGRAVDHRSDIFSLGVLLHEMATGRRPFEGASSAELVSAILRDTAPSVTDLRPDLSNDLDRVIRRCLEKDPRHRLQTVRDVSNEFRDMARTAARSSHVSTSTARAPAAADSGKVRSDEGFWVAVLPFKCIGSSELAALAEGLTDDIITNMSKFSYLRVIARGSTAHYAQRAVDVRTAAKELGARYVIEGSIRQAGTKVRIAVQLVDAETGAGLWAETYDRAFSPETTLDLLDDVVPRIVVTVADTQGVLAHSMTDALRNRDPQTLTPYEAVLRSFGHYQRVNAAEHLAARTALEHAVKQPPDRADCWATLACLYREEYTHGFNLQPDPLGRALAASRRALDAGPTNHLAHAALASTLFFQRDVPGFRAAAERAIILNPLEGYTLAYLGMLMAYSGDWERGCALAERAMQLNPHHPGWYWFPQAFNAYRQRDYSGALQTALKVNLPGFWRTQLLLAAANGELDNRAAASNAVKELLKIRPNFKDLPRDELKKWYDEELTEHLLEGLQKAGLEIAGDVHSPAVSSGVGAVRSVSGKARADEGFWVAVLPFKYNGGNEDLKALAEGLSEEVITGLSRFSYLRVIARGSTTRYSGESEDVRAIGKELGARYVMEASLRQAGSKLRLAVQLVETTAGAHLWAETYERGFTPKTLFELQDDLVPRIVATVADINGVLPRSMSEGLRSRSPEQLTPYEAVLRSFAYFERVIPEEMNAATAGLESAVEKAPAYADAWAMLALLSVQRYAQGFGPTADALSTGESAARKALAAAPANHLAWFSLAQVLFFQKEFHSFRNAAERALSLNPMDSNSLALNGEMLALSGEWEHGVSLSARARQLNPHHPGWYWHSDFNYAYKRQDYRGALEIASKMNQTSNWGAWALTAAACGQLGDSEGAARAVRELVRLRPDAISRLREDGDKWFDAEHNAHMMEGWRKAGLAVDSDGAAVSGVSATTRSSGATRAAVREDEGFWVAVLPFKYTGDNRDLKALVEGLSEEVTTGLSRFSYLRVIARGSTAKYSSETGDIRAIGKELGARYVMEGSLRQAGIKLRLAVQLVDAISGSHLWAETYERPFSPEAAFDLQDELVPRIVSTVADRHGVLPHSMSEAIQAKDSEHLTPYEAVLLGFSYAERIMSEEQVEVKACLERAVAQVPGYADAWAILAMCFCDEYGLGFEPQPSLLERSLDAARRAVKAGPSNHLAYQNLAYAHFLRREFGPCKNAAERSLTLNSLDGANVWFMGLLIAYMGDWERGCALVERAMQLNPNFPGKYRYPLVANAYRKGDYRGALDQLQRMNLPEVFYTGLEVAAAAGQLGEKQIADKALRELLVLQPGIAALAREILGKWFQPELVEHFIEGLRKAGMEIPDADSQAPPAAATPAQTASGATPAAIRGEEGFWVAVLPFRSAGGDADLEALADGLTEDITAGLSRFPYLQVIAQDSTMAYKGRPTDIRTVGRELGARYVIEGSIRKRGHAIRVNAQLMDAASGTQLWAEIYDRELGDRENKDAGTFQIQDDLTDHIVTSVADGHGVLVRSMTAPTRNRKVDELSASELVLRYYAFMQQVDPQEHAALRAGFERVLEREPNHATAWACLSNLYVLEYGDGFNPLPKPMERAREAAWRAVKIDPACQMGWKLVSVVHFFGRDYAAFREAAERAIALNPRDGTTLAYVGIMMAYAGDWERGVALVQRAKDLNRHHPGWYHNAAFAHFYRKGEYEAALLAAKKINMPEYHWTHISIAACCGMLGRLEEARAAIESLRKYTPQFLDLENVREEIARWDPDNDEVERLMQGLQKAGLKYGTKSGLANSEATETVAAPSAGTPLSLLSQSLASQAVAKAGSGAVRAEEGFWVAVLPFKHSGTNADLAALADGVTDEIVTGLSRFSYLRVIARGSTEKYSSESGDVRTIGKVLGARYVMEGSLRCAGSKLRLAVQLADTVSGAHLWAETYERAFNPESVFEVQDDLVSRVVATVADQYGVLPRSMSDVLRNRNTDALTPHEAVLRAFSYFNHITPEGHAAVRNILERTVGEAPDHADCWAMLSMIYRGEFAQGYNARPNPLDRALTAAQRAVDLAPTNALGHYALAAVYFFRKEMVPFRVYAERALSLNPLDASAKAYLGLLIAAAGEWERGCETVESAMQLNPNCPGYFYFARCCNAYRLGRYAEVLEGAARVNMSGYYHVPALRAAALGQLGRRDEASKAVQELLTLRPDFAGAARREYSKWYDADLVEHLIEGLRKAGMEIPQQSS